MDFKKKTDLDKELDELEGKRKARRQKVKKDNKKLFKKTDIKRRGRKIGRKKANILSRTFFGGY